MAERNNEKANDPAPKKDLEKKDTSENPSSKSEVVSRFGKIKTHEEFRELENEWSELFFYINEHKNDEPYNKEMFQKVMWDTLDWFSSRLDEYIFEPVDVAIYTELIKYGIHIINLSKDGTPDNGTMFSASQEVVKYFAESLIKSNTSDIAIVRRRVEPCEDDYKLIVFNGLLDDKKEFVYSFKTGDILDFVEFYEKKKAFSSRLSR